MKTVSSKLNRRYQATIPKAVRNALGLKVGDILVFDVAGDAVRVRKIDRTWARFLEDSLSEWNSPADDHAFMDL